MGNEKQFKFNESVEARLIQPISAIEKKKPDKAKKELEEGKKLLSGRQILLSWPIDPSVVGPRFRLTLLTNWRILQLTNAVFLKLKKRQRRLFTLKERNRGFKSGSANYKSNHASFSHVSNSRLGPDDAVKSFRPQPFQFRQAAFLPRSRLWIGRTLEKQLPQSHIFRKIR